MANKTNYRRRFRVSYRSRQKVNGIIFMLPWLIGFFLFFLIPLVNTFIFSFSEVGIGDRGGLIRAFNGVENYRRLFVDEVSHMGRLQYTRVFIEENIRIFRDMPITIILSLFLAILINTKFKGRGVARTIFFLPVILGMNVVASLISVSGGNDLAESTMGTFFSSGIIMRFLLEYTFLPMRVTFYLSESMSVIFQLIYNCGVQTLIFLAGLQSIGAHLYEAAKIEGATAYETFWKLTLPMLGNVLSFVLVYSFIDMFSSSVITQEIYNWAFVRGSNIGLGAALSMVYMANVLLAMALLLFFFRKIVRGSNEA